MSVPTSSPLSLLTCQLQSYDSYLMDHNIPHSYESWQIIISTTEACHYRALHSHCLSYPFKYYPPAYTYASQVVSNSKGVNSYSFLPAMNIIQGYFS